MVASVEEIINSYVGIMGDCRRRLHIYIEGNAGVGKTTLLNNFREIFPEHENVCIEPEDLDAIDLLTVFGQMDDSKFSVLERMKNMFNFMVKREEDALMSKCVVSFFEHSLYSCFEVMAKTVLRRPEDLNEISKFYSERLAYLNAMHSACNVHTLTIYLNYSPERCCENIGAGASTEKLEYLRCLDKMYRRKYFRRVNCVEINEEIAPFAHSASGTYVLDLLVLHDVAYHLYHMIYSI